jgi:hypothetical protein
MDANSGTAELFSLVFVFVFGGMFGVLLGLRLRRHPPAPEFVACPNCAEPVRWWATVCHHCHRATGTRYEKPSAEKAKGAGAS